MTITCPRCAQGIVVQTNAADFRVSVTCPRCGQRITIQVGPKHIGPSEVKRER
jgi:transcription elongation factor Elf1